MNRRLVVVAVPNDKRSRALDAAVARAGDPPPIRIEWSDAIRDPGCVGAAGRPGDYLRVESPGADAGVWHALARLGGHDRAVPDGHWRPGRAWFAGLTRTLFAIEASTRHMTATHPAAHVLAMTDKLACQQRLVAGQVPTPAAVAAASTPAALRDELRRLGWASVFVKPQWGSSGAGMIAYRHVGPREHLTTTAVPRDGWLVNDKRLHAYEDTSIDAVLAPVLADGAVVQRWIPKASTRGGPFDLRVLVVRGRVTHRVARVGRGTLTNLHLDAARSDATATLARFGPECQLRVDAACLAAAACFSGHHCIGVDAMIDVRARVHVLECNAWGDYLPNLLTGGLDAYDVQLQGLAAA
jgi:hypothetical protein